MIPQGQYHAGFAAHPVFSTLSEQDMTEIANLAELERYAPGEIVFATGDEANCMYIVTEGEIAALKTDEFNGSTEIARLIAGDSLGEIEMISGTSRTVTAMAAANLSIIRFPPRGMQFRDYLERNPSPGSRILYAFIVDIAERTRKANRLLKENSPQIQELRRQIYEDKLTNLYNKTFLEEQLPSLLPAPGGEASLLMFKPDNFKQVNDQAGHEAGDNLLIHLARLFPSILPKNALLVRYLGNEFALVLKDSGREGAVAMAEKIREFYNGLDVSAFLPVEGFHLTVSVGIACYPEHATDAARLIDLAHPLPLIGRSLGGNKTLFPEDTMEGKE